MTAQSWQIPCPRCGWANSGALVKCAKCGQPLGARPGMLVAGQSASARAERPVSPVVARPGGFVPRLIAVVVDTVILLVVSLPIYFVWVSQLQPIQIHPDTNIVAEVAQRQVSLRVALVLLQLFYFAGCWSMLGGTVGQRLLDLRVTDANAAGIGFFRAVLRWFLMEIFFIPSLITVLITPQKRAIHDMLAGTFVIQVVKNDALVGGGEPAAGKAAARSPQVVPAPVPVPVPVAPPMPAPAPAAAPGPAPEATPATYSPPPATPAPAAPATYSPPPATVPVLAPSVAPAAVAPTDFPPMPMGIPAPEANLYEPPPFADPVAPTPPPGGGAEVSPDGAAVRELYTPQPGQVTERATRAASMYSAAAPHDAARPSEPAPSHSPAAMPGSEVPADQGEAPFDFPPMAAPPK